MRKMKLFLCVTILSFLSCCATSNYGTFVTSTYVEPDVRAGCVIAGKVTGESRQTWFLYFLPIGEAPSINEAILDAKSKIEGTRFLSDISIDDRTYWGFGYSEQVVEVKATAHK